MDSPAFGLQPLVVDEFDIVPGGMPDHYIATVSIRYEKNQIVKAYMVVDDFVKARYRYVHVTGRQGSPNGTQITVWFWSSGRQQPVPPVEPMPIVSDPRRI